MNVYIYIYCSLPAYQLYGHKAAVSFIETYPRRCYTYSYFTKWKKIKDMDYVAASFVRKATDVRGIRSFVNSEHYKVST